MSRSSKYTLWLIAVLVAAFVFYTYVQYRESKRRIETARHAESRRNIYLITASGLRPDHLSSYLYQPIQTPAIDFLAYDGIRFSNTFSTSPESLSAHLTALTGLYPFHRPVADTLDFLLGLAAKAPSKDLRNLPEFLRKEGYLTAAFLSDPELRFPSFFLKLFDSVFCGNKPLYDWQSSYSVPAITQIASDWILKNRSKPHFVWLNYDEPTAPFQPPSPYDRHYAKHSYDGEIAALDEQLALFMNTLKTRGLYRQSIVILTAPYGETIQPPGTRLSSLKESNLRVPLIFAAPGILPAHQLYKAQASLVDLLPTLLSLLQKSSMPELDGRALFERGSSQEIVRDFLLAETLLPRLFGFPPQYAVRTKSGKHWISTQETTPDSEIETALRSSGIRLSSGVQGIEMEHDPAALLDHVLDLAQKGEANLALDLLQSAIGNQAHSVFLLELKGQLMEASGDLQAALKHYSQAQNRSPNPDRMDRIARVYLKLNQFDQAQAMEGPGSSQIQKPTYFSLSTRGLILFYKGKYAEAVELFNQVLKQNPYYAEAYLYRGTAYRHLKETENAIADLKRAIQLAPDERLAYQRLASLLMDTPQKLEAIPYLRKLLELEPENYGIMVQLAELHYEAGNAPQAQKLLGEVITKGDPIAKQEAKRLLAAH